MKKAGIILLIATLVLAGCSKSSSTENKAVTGDLELEENQSALYGKITEINGNEITFEVMEATTLESTGSSQSTSGSEESQGTSEKSSDSGTENSENTNKDTVNTESNNKPSGDMPSSESGSAPSGSQPPSGDMSSSSQSVGQGMPDDTQSMGQGMPGDTQSSSGKSVQSSDQSAMPSSSEESASGSGSQPSDSNSSDKSTSSKESRIIYKSTGEEKTMFIPVGTTVTTLLGVESTFSRIAVDNTIEMVTEQNDQGEDVIVAVYIVG